MAENFRDRPADHELEVSLFGPGYGESIVVHLGSNRWMVVDSCLDRETGRAAALAYLEEIGVDPRLQVELIVCTHWHDDHIRGMSYLSHAAPVILKAADGRTITATVTGVQNGEVFITKQDGQSYRLPLAGLDEASKATVAAENAKINMEINAARIREIDAEILATRKQMLEASAIARNALDGSDSGEMLYKVKLRQLELLQANLNRLVEVRNAMEPRQIGGRKMQIAAQGSGYFTTIDKINDKILSLENKAIVEVSSSFIGFIGWRKKCLLFKDGNDFKIWIEGKKTYKCDLLRAPENARTVGLTAVTINEVLRDGKFLKLSDGRILRVGDFDTFNTSMLMGPTDGLLLETGELVILDEGTIVSVEVIE